MEPPDNREALINRGVTRFTPSRSRSASVRVPIACFAGSTRIYRLPSGGDLGRPRNRLINCQRSFVGQLFLLVGLAVDGRNKLYLFDDFKKKVEQNAFYL